MTSRNKILVIGPNNGCVLEFVKGIFKASELEFPDKHVQDQLKKNEGKHSGINIPWTIDTKYYTADVSFWLDVLEKDVAEQVKGYAKEENGIGQVVDAFVYVCSLEEPETFEGIKAWLPFLDKCIPAIRLCVSTGAGSGSEAFEDWCLDHEFEYVDLEQKTVEPLDKAGWDLAVDVLQTNMWDGMKQKEQDANARQQQSNPYDDDDEDLYRELRQLKLDDKPNKAAEEDDLDDLDDMPSASEVRQMQQQLFGDLDKEDGLDKALQTMQALREQGQNLPDDERRKLAAKVALSFAAQLGIE